MFHYKRFVVNPIEENCYIIWDNISHEGAIVDCGAWTKGEHARISNFLNENGIAKRVKVQIGERFNEMIEISAPEVKEGAEIVVVGQSRLVDGVKLNVIK